MGSAKYRGIWIACVAATASVCLGHGSVHERIDAVSVRIAESPDDAELYVQRGRLWMVDESPARAIPDLEQALMLLPGHEQALLLKAGAFLQKNDFNAAATDAGNYLEQYGDQADALIILARSHVGLGDSAKAVDVYASAFELIRHVSPDLYLEQARAVASLGEAGIRQAIESLDRAMTKLGRIVSLESAALDYELKLEEHEAALIRVDRLLNSPGRTDHWKQKKAAVERRAVAP